MRPVYDLPVEELRKNDNSAMGGPAEILFHRVDAVRQMALCTDDAAG